MEKVEVGLELLNKQLGIDKLERDIELLNRKISAIEGLLCDFRSWFKEDYQIINDHFKTERKHESETRMNIEKIYYKIQELEIIFSKVYKKEFLENPDFMNIMYIKLQTPIQDIDDTWSVRASNTFTNLGVKTLKDLVLLGEIDILRSGGCGKKTLNEIKENLEKLGLSLGMDIAYLYIKEEKK